MDAVDHQRQEHVEFINRDYLLMCVQPLYARMKSIGFFFFVLMNVFCTDERLNLEPFLHSVDK